MTEVRQLNTVFTIGHSNQTLDSFVELLAMHRITALADIRSYPQSRANPQFDRVNLSPELRKRGIAYAFLGSELGGRTANVECYLDGRVQYDRLAKTEGFRKGLARIEKGLERYRVAIMCAEAEPLDCHRAILVSRSLKEQDSDVIHILRDGQLEDHDAAMLRLTQRLRLDGTLLSASPSELLSEAYRIQGIRIGYRNQRTENRPTQTDCRAIPAAR